jgi:hypothetical protein
VPRSVIAVASTMALHRQAAAILCHSWQVAMRVKSTSHKDVEHSVPTPWEVGHGNFVPQLEHVLSTMALFLQQPVVFVTQDEVEVNAS